MSTTQITPNNVQIAGLLEQIAELLADRGDNLYRVRAYENAARTVRKAKRSLAQQVRDEGGPSLKALPGVGEGLARLISNYVMTGSCPRLERLLATVSIETQMQLIPGIGPVLSARIADVLHVPTLEALEVAARTGRLQTVHGFGPQRVKMVRDALPALLDRSAAQHRQPHAQHNLQQETSVAQPMRSTDEHPSIKLLLALDADYRRQAEAGELRQIAPRRFNPTWQAWLPVMRVDREGWSFVVLYSNTAQAHRLDKTHDWVVIYVRPAGENEADEGSTSVATRQYTVVTKMDGTLAGQRVVRGREREMQRYDERAAAETTAEAT